ncbi:UDP-N-acetylglucosamine 2-epimerase (non-hydrolyzing) (plasmid) [Haloferax mediterranei ATCC 33500]|nr:UDP-N-acetylglucosamine 2-epimerase (non-hydrolyzing) [Haloferax mediterranei]AFK21354.1 UDP-N-acetylglucosamine 2-epimerase [Haloferax mediterranei ATCC 33500]AHZ24563.1 UDP-N-acetylglucosamine 2-epimerase [Haloferax mediterranei ATCC 33500]MDX5990384.1 UDP-N-acetylglucosamine 2-epimerase (non-hydrolyzing) [Haloferax mediterranei ATCC 33500]QCQ76956.1 UDP-N-acetylglucosamine 2-epimerase (non-hydrolyzing) [Haloferax mediterranei ATCC 33500]
MSRLKILSVVGARPQFIKAFPVSDALRREHDEVLVHTGQHYDESLSDVFFDELDMPEPDYNLGVGSGTHAAQTAEMMERLDTVIADEDPDVVLVYGDTNSTLAAALVAAKRTPQLAHVEAGLRSHNWEMPEEVNRVLTDHCSDFLFAPSESAAATLESEGIHDGVYVTGDVQYDAVLRVRSTARERSEVLNDHGLHEGEYILATVHRAANTDDLSRLGAIVNGLAEAPKPVFFPVHPRTETVLHDSGLWPQLADNENVLLIDPVGYLDFIRLLDGAERVVTDSGGVQKEAFYLDTRCITLRDETEWTETVDTGWNVLVGADPDAIRTALQSTESLPEKPSLYGEGAAAERIADVLSEFGYE